MKIFLLLVICLTPLLGHSQNSCVEFFAETKQILVQNKTSKTNKPKEVILSNKEIYLAKAMMALENAPQPIKDRLVKTYTTTLSEHSSTFSYTALSILMAAGVPEAKLQSIVNKVFDRYMSKVPTRDSAKKLQLDNVYLPKTKQVYYRADLFGKWDLNWYSLMVDRLFNEILPKDYAANGFYTANSDRRFDTFNVFDMVRTLTEMGLTDKAVEATNVLLTHDGAESFRDAALHLKNDDLLFKGGMFFLARYFFDPKHQLNSNKLWKAIEILKMAQEQKTKDEVKNLFIDLAEYFLSNEFSQRLEMGIDTSTAEGKEQFNSEMASPLRYVLRGIHAVGDVVLYRAEDSTKWDVASVSNDARLSSTTMKVLKKLESIQKNTLSKEDVLITLMAINNMKQIKENLEKLLSNLELDYQNIAKHYLAVGNPKKASENFFLSLKEEANFPDAIKFKFSYFLRFSMRAGQLEGVLKLWEDVLSEKEQSYVDEILKLASSEIYYQLPTRYKPTDILAREYAYFSSYNRDYNFNDYLSSAKKAENDKDDLNASTGYLRAIFAYAREIEAGKDPSDFDLNDSKILE